jgi:hypothetical protein
MNTESILFYRELLHANKEFKFLWNSVHTDNQSPWNAVKPKLNFINHLLKANEEIPKLLKDLTKYTRNSLLNEKS